MAEKKKGVHRLPSATHTQKKPILCPNVYMKEIKGLVLKKYDYVFYHNSFDFVWKTQGVCKIKELIYIFKERLL